MVIYCEVFRNSWNSSIPTFTFDKVKGDGLSFKEIVEIDKDYVILKDSISTIKLDFDNLEFDSIILGGEKFRVFYSSKYPNMRFIPVQEYENNKYLLELFEKSNRNKLENMSYKLNK